MFKIIGADQKEYGPVSTAQIRQWITDGRLNANTMAQRATGGEWQPLSAFEEFADIFQTAGAAPAPGAAPATSFSPAGAPIPTASHEMAASAVKGPAIALIVTAALGMVLYLIRSVLLLANGGMHQAVPANIPPEGRRFFELMQGPTASFSGFYLAATNGLILFGALRMLKLRGHNFALITCILAMIPCFSGGCCLLGLPFGIWGIVVLNKPEVKSQFTN